MADGRTKELQQRRSVLSESLPALSRKRDDTYRLNSDALALDRTGVSRRSPQELAQLGEGQAGADAAMRDAQRELRDVDAEIRLASGGGLGARVARVVRRARSSSQ
jgi:hypothetical protein